MITTTHTQGTPMAPPTVGVTLSKVTDDSPLINWEREWINYGRRKAKGSSPWYPLVGHRQGLRMNDLVSLASAFVIIGYHGGVAHRTLHWK